MDSDSCIFCEIAAGKIPCNKIYEDDDVIVFLDIQPISDGHTLVIPKSHFLRLDDCTLDVLEKMSNCLGRVAKAVVEAMDADGYNVLCNNGASAGQLVEHVHFHIIPRNNNDGLFAKWPDYEYPQGRARAILKEICAKL